MSKCLSLKTRRMLTLVLRTSVLMKCPRSRLGYMCRGLIVPLDCPAHDELEQVTADRNVFNPRMLTAPGEAAQSEGRLHELTHLPCRSWCPLCVKARGRQTAAIRKNDRQPVIQIDFSFVSTENDSPKRTMLNATGIQTGRGMSCVQASKDTASSNESYAAAELKTFIFQLGRTFGVIQCDKELALKAIANQVCSSQGGVSLRAAPNGHSQSMGSLGKFSALCMDHCVRCCCILRQRPA